MEWHSGRVECAVERHRAKQPKIFIALRDLVVLSVIIGLVIAH